MFTPGYSADYIAVMLKQPQNACIKDNNVNGIIEYLDKKTYANARSIPWQIAWENPQVAADRSRSWPALDLFIIHALPGLSPQFISEDHIIAHLQTLAGRASIADTVGTCLEKSTLYADRILALLDDKTSILYRGLHTHRINIWSRKEPGTMAFIRSECHRANDTRKQLINKLI